MRESAQAVDFPSVADIQRALAFQFIDGATFEVRVLNADNRVSQVGYFNSISTAAKVIAMLDARRAGNIFVTVNPVKAALFARAANHMKERRDKYQALSATTDSNIERRTDLYVDLDSIRPSGICATEAEVKAVQAKANDVLRFLREHGCSEPQIRDTGNGVAFMLPVDLPNDVAADTLVKRFLEALDFRFSDAAVKIDQSVANAARITRVPGTMNRKGDHIPERPHRRARVVRTPKVRVLTDVSVLEKVAATAPVIESPSHNFRTTSFDLNAFIAKHGIDVQCDVPCHGGRKVELAQCPLVADHGSSYGPAIFETANGLGFHCFGDRCNDKTWSDLREHFEPGHSERQREREQSREKAPGQADSPKRFARMKLLPATDVRIVRTEWLEPGYVPERKLTLLEGRGDIGKTTTAMTMLARYTRNERLFTMDEQTTARYPSDGASNVLIIAKEDDHGTLKARLRAANADMGRITFIDGLDYINEQGDVEDHDGIVYFPRDLDALKEAITRTEADVVYIDALHSHVAPEDPKDPVSVRNAYSRLIDLCERAVMTIIAVRHWGKGVGHSHDRGLGSSEILHLARAVLTFDVHPEDQRLPKDQARRVIAPTKTNLTAGVPAVVFDMETVDTHDDNGHVFTVPKIKIVGTDATITANDLAMAVPDDGKTQTQIDACIDAILTLFTTTDCATADELAAGCADFAERTRERARSALTRAGVLKRGFTGKPGEKGEVTYTVDRDAATVIAKKARWSPLPPNGDHREKMAITAPDDDLATKVEIAKNHGDRQPAIYGDHRKEMATTVSKPEATAPAQPPEKDSQTPFPGAGERIGDGTLPDRTPPELAACCLKCDQRRAADGSQFCAICAAVPSAVGVHASGEPCAFFIGDPAQDETCERCGADWTTHNG